MKTTAILFALLITLASADSREWTDTRGRKIQAEFVSMTSEGVTVRLRGKDVFLRKETLAEGEWEAAQKLQSEATLSAEALPVRVQAHQNADIGLIGKINVAVETTEPIRSKLGSIVGERKVMTFKGSGIDGVLAHAKGAKVVHTKDASRRHLGLPDIDGQYIGWEGKAWRIGQISYRTRQGLNRTCPYFTASPTEAAKFYAANGTPPNSDMVITQAP